MVILGLLAAILCIASSGSKDGPVPQIGKYEELQRDKANFLKKGLPQYAS